MQEQIKQIAMRIQVLRDILGISAEQMAEHLSMTVEQYARYEAGGCLLYTSNPKGKPRHN